MLGKLYIPAFVLALFLFGQSIYSIAGTMANDPEGFYGIRWGHSLAKHPKLLQTDSDNKIVFYGLRQTKPIAWGIPVESINFLTLNDQFAQARIHYQGQHTHLAILDYLETAYGKHEYSPGSMMRGLNQQFSWRGSTTEIAITYRGLTEHGFISIQSRILAAGLMNAISDQSF